MSLTSRVFCIALGAAAALGGWLGTAQAQGWKPTKHVEIIVGADAAGLQDRMARIMQQQIEKSSLIPTTASVVNKPGAAQLTAIAYMNSHRADPHYLVMIANSWQNTAIINDEPESLNDVTPVVKLYHTAPNHFVSVSSSIRNAQDVIERLKKDPGSVSYAMSAAPGSPNWMTTVQFARAAGVDPRKLRLAINSTGADTLTQVLGGHADIGLSGSDSIVPLQEQGKVRIIGLITAVRLPGARAGNIPTMKEQGVNAVANNWYAIVGPKGMTAEQSEYWDGVFTKAADTAEAKKIDRKSVV